MKTIRKQCFCIWALVAILFGTLVSARGQSNAAYAVSLNSTNLQYIQLPPGVWFNGNFTIEGWVYVRSYKNWSRLLDFANGPDNGNVYFALTGGGTGLPTVGVFTNNGTPVLVSPTVLPLNQWVHLALTLSGTNGTLYINGGAVTSGILNVAPNVVRTNNYFGRSNYGADEYADAIFDEIRIWNYARTGDDISLRRGWRVAANETGLVGCWRFEEGSGTVTTNLAAPNSGQLVNGPAWVVSTIASADTLSVTQGPSGLMVNGRICPGGFATAAILAWGITDDVGNSGFIPVGNGLTYTNFSASVTGVVAATTYRYYVYATNALGTQRSLDSFFTTPSILTLLPTGRTATNATLRGSAKPNSASATAWFEWGATTNYDHTTATQPFSPGTNIISFQQPIFGLTPGATVHYRAVASGTSGTMYGADISFTVPMFTLVQSFSGAGSILSLSTGFEALGDFNNDGLLDVVYISAVSAGFFQYKPQTYLFLNTTNGFTDVTGTMAPDMATNDYQYGAWLDFDGDGRLDLLMSGSATHFWRNTNGGFANVTAAMGVGLPSFSGGGMVAAAAWDYDNDGRQDLLIAGASSQLWRNTTTGYSNVTSSAAPGLSSFASTWAVWGDYDRDGLADFAIGGASGTQIWRNTGNGFTNVTSIVAPGLAGLAMTTAAWGDLNNDGWLDLLVSSSSTGVAPQLWLNTGGAGLTNAAGIFPIGVLGSPISLGDYDNDGLLDILGGGSIDQNNASIWRNTGSNFVDVSSLVAQGVPTVTSVVQGNLLPPGRMLWADYDNDGRLDLAIGWVDITNGFAPFGQIWKNLIPQTNVPPLALTGLSATVTNQTVLLSWNPGIDSTTPFASLTYNFGLGTSPGSFDIVNPLADPSGRRRLPTMGNRQNTRAIKLSSLKTSQPYYWSVQAEDAGYAGSPLAFGTFTLGVAFLPPSGVLVPGDANGDGIVSPDELSDVLNHVNGPVSPGNVQQVLSNFLAQSPLFFTNTTGLGGTNVTFGLTNSPTNLFSVEYSTNLADWQFLGSGSLRYGFTDTNAATGAPRYYRLRLP